jgi:hypothetical protein
LFSHYVYLFMKKLILSNINVVLCILTRVLVLRHTHLQSGMVLAYASCVGSCTYAHNHPLWCELLHAPATQLYVLCCPLVYSKSEFRITMHSYAPCCTICEKCTKMLGYCLSVMVLCSKYAHNHPLSFMLLCYCGGITCLASIYTCLWKSRFWATCPMHFDRSVGFAPHAPAKWDDAWIICQL